MSSIPIPSRGSRVAAALAERHRRERPRGLSVWREPRELGRSLGLAPSEVRTEVEQAERLGLVDLADFGAGPRVSLSDLGWKLFDLDDRRPGPRRSAAPRSRPEDPDLVTLLRTWRSAAPQAQDLADHLGRDVEEFWDEVLAAESRGEVETWPDHPAGPTVMLSSLAAGRLGLELSSDGTRWLRPRQDDPTSIERSNHDVAETSLGLDPDRPGLLDDLADPCARTGPEELEARESAEAQADEILDRLTDPEGERVLVLDHEPTIEERWSNAGKPQVFLPAPHLILGQALQWPVRGLEGQTCRGCRDRKLGRTDYCLLCDRSGVDDLIRYLLEVSPGPRRIKQHRPDGAARVPRAPRSSKSKGQGNRKGCQPADGLRGGLGS